MPVHPREGILKVLAYFDIFKYPLTIDEIAFFHNQKMRPDEVALWLQQLTGQHRVFRLGEFYSLHNEDALRQRRLNGNNLAGQMLPRAYRIARFLYQFPFVRGIGISGSLSKHFAEPHSDIDLFIITRANRLWIARTCMHLFKKLSYLVGRQHWFCMNYYIDEEALHIEEHNIFTATEIATLLPAAGMNNFFIRNDWVKTYFPNAGEHKKDVHSVRNTWYKQALEWVFDRDWLDDYLLRLTNKRWILKEQAHKRNAKGNRMGLRNGKHFSKPNPVFFQQKILEAWHSKVQAITLSNLDRMIV
jgi:Nucleotidyltransferase domain.